MSRVFPDDCYLSRRERLIFLDTMLEGEIPCFGCPVPACQAKADLMAAITLSGGGVSDFQSVKCPRCGGRVREWRVDGMSRVWRCRNPVEVDTMGMGKSWMECGGTYSVMGGLVLTKS